MKTGALRQVVLRTPRAFAFGPAQLTPGAWYDGLDGATMFQDTAGTIPSTVGTPAARWNDKSGFGNHLTQTTGSSQPTRGTFGPTFDGADRYLALALSQGVLPQPYTWVVVCDNQSNGTMFLDNNGGAGARHTAVRGSVSTEVSMAAITVVTRTGVPDLGTRRAWFFAYNGAASTIKCGSGGSLVQQGAAGNAGTGTCSTLGVGGATLNFLLTGTGSREGMGELILIPRLLTAPEETNLMAYLTARHGIV